MSNLVFRKLRADEIELRVGNVSQNGCTLLLYKDARCDMTILDETVGAMNWQRDHKEIKGVMYGGVAIWDVEKNQWVTKWDAGTESNTEQQKGEASDSFKRADVNWGIGRELYTAPMIFIKCDTVEYKDKNGKTRYNLKNTYQFTNYAVSKVDYIDDTISELQISDKGKLVWDMNKFVDPTAPQPPPKKESAVPKLNPTDKISEARANSITAYMAKMNIEPSKYISFPIEELTNLQADELGNKLKAVK
jgi:hypothetical protein